jgi:hypothetical protein
MPGREGLFEGRVVWCGTPDGRDDAALVAIDDPCWTPVDGTTVRWGKTVTHRPGLRCKCWGVPDVVQRPGYPVDTAQLTGRLNPGDGMVSDRYSIRLDGHPPAAREDGRSPWGGLSGSAVFCGDLRGNDLLVGVIASDLVPFGHSVLEAVPAYVLHHDPEFRAALAVHSPATVIEAAELAELACPEPGPQLQDAVVSPAKLLTAQRAVVGFRGRADLLEQLRTWVQQPGIGLCLVHGPGGQGKTRLARQFGDQLAQDAAGRIVLWLDRAAPAADLAVIADTVVPVLVVVDYAESRPRQLTALLTALSTCRRQPAVKVLALARTAGDWWDQLADTSDAVADLLEAATVTALPVLDATHIGRLDSYRAAVAAFAKELARLHGHAGTDWLARAAVLVDRPLPSTAAAWTVLAIQMTALADLLDAATGSTGDGSRLEATEDGSGAERDRSPEGRVIRHERRYWKNTAEAAEVPLALSRSVLSDIVAATILLRPPTPEKVNDWLARIPELTDQPLELRGRVRTWLAGLYPAVGPYAFGQLEPDRLGEHLIGILIADKSRISIAESLAAHVDGEDAIQWVSICARAAGHPGLGERVGELLTRMLEKHPETVAVAALNVAPGLEAPEPLVHAMECLVRNPTTPTASLTRVDRALPTSSLLWTDTAAELSAVLVDRCQPEEPDGESHVPQDQADLTTLVNGASWIIENTIESMGLSVVLSRSDRAWHKFNLATRLADAGRPEEALDASTEAVEMFRRLAERSGSRDSLPQGQDTNEEC